MSIQTKQYMPLYHNMNVRTEFRLDPNETYFSNLRLIELSSGIDNGNYLLTTGVFSLIKNIYFYDGNVQIDQVNKVDLYGTVKNLLTTNRTHTYLRKDLINDQWAWDPEINDTGAVVNQNTVNLTSEVEGYIELKDLFGFLRATPYFRFAQPRIVIEWNTNKLNIFTQANPGTGALDIQKPLLLADQIIGQTPVFESVTYLTTINDRVTIPAVVQGSDSGLLRYKIGAFNNKHVNRLLLCFTPLVKDDDYGYNSSYAQEDESYQIYVNKSTPVFPTPVTQQNKGMYFEQIFGSQNFPLGLDLWNLQNADSIADVSASGGYFAGSQSWGACLLDNIFVTDLQISYRRTGGPTSPQQEAIVLYILGEVPRKVTYKPNSQTVVEYV